VPWVRSLFKDKVVFAEADAAGKPVVHGGRRVIRYSDAEGAKLYRAGASGITDGPAGPVDLPEGVDADEAGPAARAPAGRASGGRGSGFGKAGTRTAAQTAAAEADARTRIAAAAEMIRCFTDGACMGNPGPAGSGCRVEFPDGRAVEESWALGRGTNNIAELTAVEMALEVLDREKVPAATPVVIYSDSGYARGVLTQGWKAKANVELIAAIKARLRTRGGVRMEWVAGHAGIAGNERADVLAGKGVDRSKRGEVD
jgi:ribonuclease HI